MGSYPLIIALKCHQKLVFYTFIWLNYLKNANYAFFYPWSRRWNHGSTVGLFLLLLLLLLLHTTKFLFLLGTENTNFQTGSTFQATPVTPISSCFFYFLECFLSGELSTPVQRTVHRLQAVQWLLLLFSKNPALGWIYNCLRSGSQIKASPGLNIKLAHYYCLRKTDSTVNTSQSSKNNIANSKNSGFWLYKHTIEEKNSNKCKKPSTWLTPRCTRVLPQLGHTNSPSVCKTQ